MITASDTAENDKTLRENIPGESNARLTTTGADGMPTAAGLARLVLAYVRASTAVVDGLGGDDEMRLLRLRTKKLELVIVPGILRLAMLTSVMTDELTRRTLSAGGHFRGSSCVNLDSRCKRAADQRVDNRCFDHLLPQGIRRRRSLSRPIPQQS